MEKKYEILIAEQNISATEIRALANEPRGKYGLIFKNALLEGSASSSIW